MAATIPILGGGLGPSRPALPLPPLAGPPLPEDYFSTALPFIVCIWPRSGPRTKEPKLVGRRAGNGGTKESDVVRITL